MISNLNSFLNGVVEELDSLSDPFYAAHSRSILKDALKLSITVEEGAAVSMDYPGEEDVLLPVFFSTAARVFPSQFNFMSSRRILISGGPFCGKTVLLKHLALLCATDQAKGLHRGFVPIYFTANEVCEFINTYELGMNDDILTKFLAKKYRYNNTFVNIVLAGLKSQHCWLLIDSLDFVVDAYSLDVFISFLEKTFLPSRPMVRVILGSRYDGISNEHRDQMTSMGFVGLRIRPLTTLLAEEMAVNTLNSLGDAKKTYRAIPNWLRSEIRRPRFELFRKNPLTLLTMLHVILEMSENNSLIDLDDEDCKTRHQGHNLRPPMSQNDIFQTVILNMLEWERGVDSCLVRRKSSSNGSISILFQNVAYQAHDNRTREIKLRDIYATYEQSGICSFEDLEELVVSIQTGLSPLFTKVDYDDFMKEETLEQQQHQSPRQQDSPHYYPSLDHRPVTQIRDPVAILINITVQEHFAAKYIAHAFLTINSAPSPRRRSSVHNNIVAKSPRRRGSLPDLQLLRSPSYEDPAVKSRIQDLVERLLLGHFEPSSYRISKEWWQPVILSALDIIYESESVISDSSLFQVIISVLIDTCTRLQQYNNGRAPLCVEALWLAAAAHGNYRVAKAFMSRLGARTVLQAVNTDWNNALHLAAINNQPEIITLLMSLDEVDADYLDRNNRHGWDPSNMAMVFNHTCCFRLLCCTDGDKVAEGDNLEVRPALVDAAMRGDMPRVQRLLADPSAGDDEGAIASEPSFEEDEPRPPARKSSHDLINSLTSPRKSHHRRRGSFSKRTLKDNLQKVFAPTIKVDVNVRGSTGMTPLMWAARNGHTSILNLLIDAGGDVSAKAQGISTLIFAVESGHVDCVRRLIEAGADPMDRTPDDDSSLLCACSFGFDDVARELIGSGASALEALVVSCVQGKNSTVRSLVESGLVDVNTVWQDLMVTPIAGACVAGHIDTVQLLLALGADPNVPIDVEYGSTPLMLACHMGNLEVVQTMVEAGANVNARAPPSSQCAQANGSNATPVSIAHTNEHIEVEQLLRGHGAKIYIDSSLTMYEWLGGRVSWPLMDPEFQTRLKAGNSLQSLVEDDEFLSRPDLSAWQMLGGRTAGEAAWDSLK